jgi:branched-chain amino acid transport system permease protein
MSNSMTDLDVFIQQLITGSSNGMIIALIALGYTMVYGIIELINFAHGDLFMLGAFAALTVAGLLTSLCGEACPSLTLAVLLITTPLFCAGVNWAIDRYAFRPLRKSNRLAPLVSAIGISFILMNLGLFWGSLPMEVFNLGRAAASPKDFPALLPGDNLFGDERALYLSIRELIVVSVTIPLLIALSWYISHSKTGRAMRAVAQNPTAAALMGIDVPQIISRTFMLGGALAGVASVIYATYNGTIHFQMGYRVGMDAFTAAVVGGIGNFYGAVVGGILIGILRACSDQYLSTEWTNIAVFCTLVLVLMFRPSGLFGATTREKV